LRAITEDGSFRVIVARTTETTRDILRLQQAEGATAETLADLLTATVLFRETMAPGLRVQGILKTEDQRGTIVSDSAPKGKTRGLLQRPSGSEVVAKKGSLLRMIRTLHNGSINQGLVSVPEGGGVTEAMMVYMQESEQVDTMLSVGTVFDDEGRLVSSGGYLVQLLPEVGKAPLAVMAERLEDFRTIHHLLTPDFSPEWLLSELLYAMPHTVLETTPVMSECWCSEQRLLGALVTLGKEEIASIVTAGEPLQINCDYCGKDYTIVPNQLRGLLDAN
jgi:molecular chaperone Hsp33